jgi:hypothetical protein
MEDEGLKKISTVLLALIMLVSAMTLTGCGTNTADQAFTKFQEDNDALVQSLLEPSEDWLNEPDGGESIVLEEMGKVDKLLAGLDKLDKSAMSKKNQETYANIYGSFVTHKAALEAIREQTREVKPGGYSQDREVTPDDLAIFEAVMADAQDAEYEPTFVATQVVAGTNYRFTATATPKSADAKPYSVYVYIYQPLDGEPELTEIEPVGH